MNFLDEWFKSYQRMFGEMDSRLNRWKKGEKLGSVGPINRAIWEPCYCFNCGADGGYVTRNTPIIYICDQCEAKCGALPLPKVPAILEQEYRIP
jgi:hypothetical protein